VQIIFDPKIVPYEKLLELFWELHDPAYALRSDEKSGHSTSIIYCHFRKTERKGNLFPEGDLKGPRNSKIKLTYISCLPHIFSSRRRKHQN
jgi:peptide methionine sulfoxide reductase MsrA